MAIVVITSLVAASYTSSVFADGSETRTCLPSRVNFTRLATFVVVGIVRTSVVVAGLMMAIPPFGAREAGGDGGKEKGECEALHGFEYVIPSVSEEPGRVGRVRISFSAVKQPYRHAAKLS